MNRFTEKIHDKGLLVREFCEYWGFSRRTYERMLADDTKHDKLDKLIEASGFDIESTNSNVSCACTSFTNQGCHRCNFKGLGVVVDYKVTKRDEEFISMSKERYAKLMAGYKAWENHE